MKPHTLHIVAGPPASGKSVFGRRLAARLKAAFLDIDTVSEPIVQAGLALAGEDPEDRDSATFKAAFREPIYQTMLQTAQENLAHTSVVIVGPFTREFQEPDWLDAITREIDSPVEAYYITAQPEVRRQRMIARGNPRDRSKLANWDAYLRYYGEQSAPPFAHYFEDNSDSG